MKTIETERLILRPFVVEDIPASYALNLDDEISRYTGDGGVLTFEEIEKRIRHDVIGDYSRNGYGRHAVIWKEAQAFIGFAGLKYLSEYDEVDLGYRLNRGFWGRGLATEAGEALIDFGFSDLELDKIVALVLPENKASIRVLEKLGFDELGEVIEEGLLALKFRIERPN